MQSGDKMSRAATAASLSLGHAAGFGFRSGRAVVRGHYLGMGSHDGSGAGESRSTEFGSFCSRQLVRISASTDGPLLRVCRGEKQVK